MAPIRSLRCNERTSSAVNDGTKEEPLHPGGLSELAMDRGAYRARIARRAVGRLQAVGGELRGLQREVDAFARDGIDQTGRITDEQTAVHGRPLVDQGRLAERGNRPAVAGQAGWWSRVAAGNPARRGFEQL